MPYRAPVPDITFCLDHVVGFDRVQRADRFADASSDLVSAILTEAGRICEDVVAPLNRAGDLHPAALENGVVRTAPGFGDGYRALASAGFMGMSADPKYGGLGLPHTLTTAVNEMIGGACLALELNPLMTQGQIEALQHHATDEIKALYLPRLISGEWCGTMNLTEPQAGSDVGALTTRAVPNGDGTYAISGQKIYISWGDSDFAGNIVHLVLARLPDAAPGTKGVSLFLVPRNLPDDAGNPGVANSLGVVSVEHKMGLHGSPTCVLQYEDATGWLIGEANRGMAAMFTMMNNARLGVGVQGVSVADAALQHALAFAQDRRQGRSPVADGTGTIIDHADVRRMLMEMKAEVFAARAMCLDLAVSIDLATAGDETAHARAAFLTPIVKAYGTETGIKVANMGIQVHGGMGVIEETGAAQFARDVRVTAIYEGTNGIQAMDLAGRKLMDGGAAAFALLDEIADYDSAFSDAIQPVAETLRGTTADLLARDGNDRFGGAVPFLMAYARLLGAHYHAKAGAGGDATRTAIARYHITRLLPEAHGLMAQARCGSDGLYDLSADDLAG